MAIQIEFLRSLPHFEGVQPDELMSIGHRVFEKVVDRGDMVFLEGQQAEALYFVASGVLKLFKTSSEGKEQILKLAGPGESLNDIAIFDGGPNLASAQAMGRAVIYGIVKADLELVIQDHALVAKNICGVLASQARHLVSLVEDLSFRHVTGRIAKILLESAGDINKPGGRLTQREMAAMAGTVREVVGRALKVLEEQGLIRLERHRITIINKEALRGAV